MRFDQMQAERFAALALDCVHREFPNKIVHALNSLADVKSPRDYDWHSAVHNHATDDLMGVKKLLKISC